MTCQNCGPVELVTVETAAHHLGVSATTIKRRVAEGKISRYRIGRLSRVDLREVRTNLIKAAPKDRLSTSWRSKPC